MNHLDSDSAAAAVISEWPTRADARRTHQKLIRRA